MSQRILERVILASFLVGLLLAGMGIYLVAVGVSGDTEFSFFGQTFRSTNVGIASIFIGGALNVLNLRRTLASFDKTLPPLVGKKSAGQLRMTDIRVTQDEMPRSAADLKPAKCLVDFWVSIDGGSQTTITAVDLDIVDTARCEWVKGAMKASETYSLDITELRKPGQRARCNVSQVIEPGESDRFSISIIAARLGLGLFAVWRLRPTLITNYGEVQGQVIEVWLPYRDPDASFDKIRDIQSLEATHGIQR